MGITRTMPVAVCDRCGTKEEMEYEDAIAPGLWSVCTYQTTDKRGFAAGEKHTVVYCHKFRQAIAKAMTLKVTHHI